MRKSVNVKKIKRKYLFIKNYCNKYLHPNQIQKYSWIKIIVN